MDKNRVKIGIKYRLQPLVVSPGLSESYALCCGLNPKSNRTRIETR